MTHDGAADQGDSVACLLRKAEPGSADQLEEDESRVVIIVKGGRDAGEGAITPLSKRQKLAIMAMGLSNFSSFLAFATIAPFFPKEASAKGATDTEVGFIFGIFQLVIFFVSPLYGILAAKIGPRFVYLSGLFICSVCIVLFGFVDRSPPGGVYVTLCFICRIIDANGTAMLTTASFTIMAHSFPNHLSLVMGILEACVAMGAMCGPPLGGALYQVGGFQLPFFVVGGVLLTAFASSFVLIPHIDGESGEKKFYTLLKVPDAVLSFFNIFGVNLQISYMDPTLSYHILSVAPELSTAAIGGVFLVAPCVYGLLAPLVGHLCDKMGDRLKQIIVLGCIISAISLLVVGPAPFLTFLPRTLWLIIVSLIFHGLGLVGCWLPSFQLTLNAAIKSGHGDNLETHGMVAGLLGSGAALGAFTGPSAGAYLAGSIGFDWTAVCCSAVAVTMALGTAASALFQRLKATSTEKSAVIIGCSDETQPLLRHHS